MQKGGGFVARPHAEVFGGPIALPPAPPIQRPDTLVLTPRGVFQVCGLRSDKSQTGDMRAQGFVQRREGQGEATTGMRDQVKWAALVQVFDGLGDFTIRKVMERERARAAAPAPPFDDIDWVVLRSEELGDGRAGFGI